MIKFIILLALVSSCAVFEGAKTLLEGSYQAGKYSGREEILRELKKNEQSLEPFQEMTVRDLLNLSKDEMVIAPLTLKILQLIRERNQLKKALQDVKNGTL